MPLAYLDHDKSSEEWSGGCRVCFRMMDSTTVGSAVTDLVRELDLGLTRAHQRHADLDPCADMQ